MSLFKWIKKQLFLRKYKGTKFICPFCKIKLDNFIPLTQKHFIGPTINNIQYYAYDCETINVENYSCPNCGASDRERLYYAYFELLADKIRLESSIIHFAPENALSKYLRKQNKYKYYTADLFMKNVDFKVDITAMNMFSNDRFDAFICSHILEHIEEDTLALQELYRILKPGGWGILMVPLITKITETYEDKTKTTPEERTFYFGQKDHVRVYAKQDFINKVTSSGFKVNQLGANDFGAATFDKYGITTKSILYIVSK